MTQHFLEVWVTIFAVFAVGSLMGWLIYRWIERTDYAYDQHEFARRIARLFRREDRLAGEEAVEPGEALLASGAGERIRRRYRRRGAPDGAAVLRERVQTSSLAAAWRQRRQGDAPETRTEPTVAKPVTPIEGEILPKERTAPAAVPPPASPRPAPAAVSAAAPASAPMADLDDDADDANWEPVAPVTWPGIRSWPQLAGRTMALLPPPGSPPSFAAAVPPRAEDIWGEPEEAYELAAELPVVPEDTGPEPEPEPLPAPPIDLPTPADFEEAEAPLPLLDDDDETFFIEAVTVAPDVIAPAPPPEPRPAPAARAPEPPRGPTPMPPPRTTSRKPVSGPTVRVRAEPAPRPPAPPAARTPKPAAAEGVTRPKSAIGLPPSSPANGQRPPGLLSPPARPDALRRIKGIGPGFETRLHELGIYRYAQIAGWTAEQQRWIGMALGASGRIERDNWVNQAIELLKPKAAPRPAPLPLPPDEG